MKHQCSELSFTWTFPPDDPGDSQPSHEIDKTNGKH